MTKTKAKVAKVEGGRKLNDRLLFQRIGGGMATFKMACPDVLSNPVVQFPASVLPDDYGPDKYDVTGEFTCTVTATRKA